jgi:hypothetical protein
MSKYTFAVEMPITMSVDIEADTLEEAVEQAKAAHVIRLCNQCSDTREGEWSTTGELDGDPQSCAINEAWKDDKPQDLEELQDLWDGGIYRP